MNLWIDGRQVEAVPGERLLDAVRRLGLDHPELSRRPLAARIAGETFTLNYVPQREEQEDPAAMRRAMEASGGRITLLRYADSRGRQVYTRTVQFVLFLAIRQLYPGAVAKMNFTVGQTLNVTVEKEPAFTPGDVPALKERVAQLVEMDIPLLRKRITTQEAMAAFAAGGQVDQARLLTCIPMGIIWTIFMGRWLPPQATSPYGTWCRTGGRGCSSASRILVIRTGFASTGSCPTFPQYLQRASAGATSWAALRWRISMTWCSRDA